MHIDSDHQFPFECLHKSTDDGNNFKIGEHTEMQHSTYEPNFLLQVFSIKRRTHVLSVFDRNPQYIVKV